MLHYCYTKFIKGKVFYKILLAYCLVTVTAISTVCFIALVHIREQQENEYIELNEQALQSISSRLENEISTAKNNIEKLYTDKLLYEEIVYISKNGYTKHLEYKLDRLIKSPINKYQGFEDHFKTCLLSNTNIIGFSIYSYQQDYAFVYSRFDKIIYRKDEFVSRYLTSDEKGLYDFKIIPSHKVDYTNGADSRVFSIAFQIKDTFSPEHLGYIIVDIQTDAFNIDMQKLSHKYTGKILIYKSGGEVIFDSSNEFYDKVSHINRALLKNSKSSIIQNDSIISSRSFSSDIYIEALLKKPNIWGTIKQGKIILLFGFILILATLILTFLVMRYFSKRITSMMAAIDEIGKGNLKIRIPVYNKEDELSIISRNFNIMCDQIEEYIKKVYIFEIKQKNAQIKALQAQINPHYLYNTLEAIRMRALVKGVKDVSDMIYILSTMFRKSFKENMIISIGEEIKYTKMYLELFNIRYEGKIKVEFDISEENLNYGILQHCIQPFIENYILHGFDMDKENNILIIRSKGQGENIHIHIIDNGTGFTEERLEDIKASLNSFFNENQKGIGIANVNERLKLFFGNGYGVEISSTLGKGTCVLLKIPAILKEELQTYAQDFNS